MSVCLLVQSRVKAVPAHRVSHADEQRCFGVGQNARKDLLKHLVFHRADCLGKVQQQKASRQHRNERDVCFPEKHSFSAPVYRGLLPAACDAQGCGHPHLLPRIKRSLQ